MKILIFSDSHGFCRNMEQVLMKCRHSAEAVLFLGDGCADIDQLRPLYPEYSYAAVTGNGDRLFCAGYERESMIQLEGFNILMLHGHEFGVSGGLQHATEHARERGADVLLFGHTHLPYEIYLPECDGKRALYLFNPGSISRPRGGGAPSFGTLEIRGGQLMFGHGEIN